MAVENVPFKADGGLCGFGADSDFHKSVTAVSWLDGPFRAEVGATRVPRMVVSTGTSVASAMSGTRTGLVGTASTASRGTSRRPGISSRALLEGGNAGPPVP
jgi:hypothetical protein